LHNLLVVAVALSLKLALQSVERTSTNLKPQQNNLNDKHLTDKRLDVFVATSRVRYAPYVASCDFFLSASDTSSSQRLSASSNNRDDDADDDDLFRTSYTCHDTNVASS
jgi:hypothetical protein